MLVDGLIKLCLPIPSASSRLLAAGCWKLEMLSPTVHSTGAKRRDTQTISLSNYTQTQKPKPWLLRVQTPAVDPRLDVAACVVSMPIACGQRRGGTHRNRLSAGPWSTQDSTESPWRTQGSMESPQNVVCGKALGDL